MNEFEINGTKFEVNYNKPYTTQVYCVSYDVYGEFIGCSIIDTIKGRVAVNQFDVPYFGIVNVAVSNGKVYRTIYQEV